MATFSIRKPIGPCRVDKGLILELESYIQQKSSDLAGVRQGMHKYYRVAMRHKDNGKLDVHSANELPLSPMPGDIESIEMSSFGLANATTLYEMRVYFSVAMQSPYHAPSRYEISITSDNAKELVYGIEGELTHIIGRYRLKRFIRKPTLQGMFSFWGAGFILLFAQWLAGIYLFSYASLFLLVSGVLVIASGFLLDGLLPHCFFDTLDNKEREGRIQGWLYAWLSAVAGTLLAAVCTFCYDFAKTKPPIVLPPSQSTVKEGKSVE
jgi:hypothetical protein